MQEDSDSGGQNDSDEGGQGAHASGQPFFGIDFGTSNCSIAYVVNDPRQRDKTIIDVAVIETPKDEGGDSMTKRVPSVISVDFTDKRKKKPLLGWKFVQAFFRRKRTAHPLLHGRDFFRSVKSDMGANRVYPHSMVEGIRTPAQAAAEILKHLVGLAVRKNPDYDPRKSHVFITVPASYSALARRETLEAARIAGLDPRRVELMDEPVAALVDFLNGPDVAGVLESDKFSHLLVYDYGGGTCDLALVKAKFDAGRHTGLHVENLAISQYRRLGGDDVDRAIMREVVWPQIRQDWQELPARTRKLVEDTLICTVAEKLKVKLCLKVSEAIREDADAGWIKLWGKSVTVFAELPSVLPISDTDLMIPRRFVMNSDQFAEVMTPFVGCSLEEELGDLMVPVLEVLDRAGISPNQLDGLILHGGGCKNPYVRNLMKESFTQDGSLFARTKVRETPDLDASVARGAALACYWKHAREEEIIRPILAEGLGVITLNDKPESLVDAGKPLPYPDAHGLATVDGFFVARRGQTQLLVPVYTGSKESHRIAGSVVIPLPPGLSPGAPVRIKLRVDENKTLHWWFSVNSGPDVQAKSLDNPWTPDVFGPEAQALIEHRRKMRETLVNTKSLPQWMELEEASRLRSAGRLEEALLAIEEFLAGHATSAEAWNMKGLLESSLACKDKGLRAYQRAAELAPANAVYRGNVGCTLSLLGRTEEAIAAIRAALAINPDLAYLYKWLGSIYRDLGQENAALREFQRAERLLAQDAAKRHDSPDAWEQLAKTRQDLADYAGADEAAQTAARLRRDARYGGDSSNIIAGKDSGFLWSTE